VVGVEDLAEEDPERHQGGVDPVVPGDLDLAEGLLEAGDGEDIAKGRPPPWRNWRRRVST
jgi:hypothetical protein